MSSPHPDDEKEANILDMILVVLALFFLFFLCWRLRGSIPTFIRWSCYLGVAAIVITIGCAVVYPKSFMLLQYHIGENKHHIQQSQVLALSHSLLYDLGKNIHRAITIFKGTHTPLSSPPPPPPPSPPRTDEPPQPSPPPPSLDNSWKKK